MSAGQCWLPSACPSSRQVRIAISGARCARPSRWTIMTSRKRIRTAMPVALLASQTNMSPSRMTVTIKRDGKFGSFGGLFPEAIFLRLPLIQFEYIDCGTGQSLRPFAIVDVAENCFNDDHGELAS